MRAQLQRNRLRTVGPVGATSARHRVGEGDVDTFPVGPDELTVCVDRSIPRPVVSVIGALDVSGAALLSAMLEHVRQTEGRNAVVDLTRVDYVDSHGLAPLLDAHATICGASPLVRRLLELLHSPPPVSASDEDPSGVPTPAVPRPG